MPLCASVFHQFQSGFSPFVVMHLPVARGSPLVWAVHGDASSCRGQVQAAAALPAPARAWSLPPALAAAAAGSAPAELGRRPGVAHLVQVCGELCIQTPRSVWHCSCCSASFVYLFIYEGEAASGSQEANSAFAQRLKKFKWYKPILLQSI